jgi:Plexin repeat
MTRSLAAAVLASIVAVALGACGDDSSDSGYAYAGGGGSSGGDDSCNQYTTCDSCTPVNGCGWCFNATSGLCAASPDECTNVNEFTWTWDPTGCPDVDASVTPLDAGSTPVKTDAAPIATDAAHTD